MEIDHGMVEGDLLVDGNFVLFGMVTGSITVRKGGCLTLHGMCCKDLIIEEGGLAIVPGMVSGNLIDRGGSISVTGIVRGQIHTVSKKSKVPPND